MNDSQLQGDNPILAWLVLILAIFVLLTGGVAAYLALRGVGSSERLAFVAGGASEGLDLYLADAAGRHRVNLTESRGDELGIAWSPDGNRLAYCHAALFGETGGPGAADASVYLINMGDSDAPQGTHELLYAAEDSAPLYPTWSPDGRRMALAPIPGFVREGQTSGAETTLVLIDMQTRQSEERVLPLRITAQSLSWSADGSQLAFVGVAAEGQDAVGGVYVYALDTQALTRIAPGATEAVWSPLEPWLACANLDGQGGLVLLNPDGSVLRRLESEAFISGIAFSPDGGQLVCGRVSHESYDLSLYDLATGEVSQLVSGIGGAAQYPSWSPSGTFVAYTVFAADSGSDVAAWIEVLDMRSLNSVTFAHEQSFEGMAVWQPGVP